MADVRNPVLRVPHRRKTMTSDKAHDGALHSCRRMVKRVADGRFVGAHEAVARHETLVRLAQLDIAAGVWSP